ncbi:MAG: hypothetical protein HYV90_03635 [Candidatus Woesebacteria bacterium]|nr:MAG: hypothetical protein HYV90_03635 [Candidatus Woesebacteria bacterium]
MNINRPYIIIPKLIIQPTWGGTYIAKMKGWQNLPVLQDKKIGQSYELFSGTKLATSIFDTSDPKFIPEIGFPDSPETVRDSFNLVEGADYIQLADENMPLLIKFTQALGNSFQLHIKHDVSDARWKPKAESWYYFEDGKLTFGIKKGADIDEYKKICLEIDKFMQNLSREIKGKQKSLDVGRAEAHEFILNKNPWQFVNVYEVKKYEIVDPSLGGIHHSWEEDNEKYPLGNVLYEIQEDVMDPISTIRAFDQGKIKDDGSIRELNIDDYFKYLDKTEENNNIDRNRTLSNSVYAMEVLNIDKNVSLNTNGHFHHLFVRDGSVEIQSNAVNLKVGQGHSVFVPKELGDYNILSGSDETCVLKTVSSK